MEIEVKKTATGYVAFFGDYEFQFSNVNKATFTALVKVVRQKVLYIARVSLIDPNERWKMAEHLRILKDEPWLSIITLIFTKVVNEMLNVEPITRLQKVPRESAYFCYPVLAEPYTLIFAPGGSGKSYFALLLALALQNNIDFGFLKLENENPIKVLYLDWETSHQDMSRRYTLFTNGLGELESPFYRQMTAPLYMEFETCLDDITKEGIKLVIIDSVVPSIGGEINHADKVGDYFRMLREFYRHGARTLLLTHVNKQDKRSDESKSPIGSVFFENYPRLVWELKSVNLTKKLQIDLTPVKFNVPRPPEISIALTFEEDSISLENIETNDLKDELKELIIQQVEQQGVVKIKDLIKNAMAALGVSESAVRRKIEELKRAGILVTVEWGTVQIAENNDEPPF